VRCVRLSLAIPAWLLSGCIHSYYVPNSPNVPLLTKEKEARVSAHFYSTSRDFFNTIPGLEIQGSYAPAPHVGLMGSFLTTGKTQDGARFSALYGDIGAGYFTSTKNRHWVFECYGGYGLGTTKNTFVNLATSAADYSKIFIQPILGYRSRYFDAAFTWRFASIQYSSLRLTSQLPAFAQAEYDWTLNNSTYRLHEPALVLRFGDDPLKVQLVYGLSIPDKHADPRLVFSVALVASFPWKREEDKK
jgi:hypothetical protein